MLITKNVLILIMAALSKAGIFVVLMFSVASANEVAANEPPTVPYSAISCSIENDQGSNWFTMQPLMVVTTEKGVSKFAQIKTVSESSDIQYQVFIEPIVKENKVDSFLVLQNFAIDGKEVSKEFETGTVESIEIQQGAWSAHCEVSL